MLPQYKPQIYHLHSFSCQRVLWENFPVSPQVFAEHISCLQHDSTLRQSEPRQNSPVVARPLIVLNVWVWLWFAHQHCL